MKFISVLISHENNKLSQRFVVLIHMKWNLWQWSNVTTKDGYCSLESFWQETTQSILSDLLPKQLVAENCTTFYWPYPIYNDLLHNLLDICTIYLDVKLLDFFPQLQKIKYMNNLTIILAWCTCTRDMVISLRFTP